MQIPVISELLSGTTRENRIPPALIPLDMVFSIESQLKLRSLYQYVDFCKQTLEEIQRDLVLCESGPECSMHLKKASERLGKFCVEADSWDFGNLYQIAFGLQTLLLNAGGRAQSNRFWEALQRGLSMLSILLEQCERDFRLRLAAADTLDFIREAAGN